MQEVQEKSSLTDYERIRTFINQQIELRDRRGCPVHNPSRYWQDFNKFAGYVRRLTDEDLKHIRYHTWHLTGDTYLTYIFNPQQIPYLMEEYLKLAASLDGFKIDEPEDGLGYDTDYGKVSTDLLRYMRVLSDLYTHGKISREEGVKVLEIGGGYGQLARVFLSFNRGSSYVICDLEETMFFQGVYLSNTLGADKVRFLTGEEPFDFKFAPGTVYLLPQHRTDALRQYRFDLAVNQQSMQEMTQEQVDHYLDLIKQSCRYFYSCNLDQHISFIVSRTGIVTALNDYLASQFAVEWSSKRPEPALVPVHCCDNSQASRTPGGFGSGTVRWLQEFLSVPELKEPGFPKGESSPTATSEFGDYKIPRMILRA